MEKKWTPPCIILIVQYEYWLLMNQDNSNEEHVSGDLEKLNIYKFIIKSNKEKVSDIYIFSVKVIMVTIILKTISFPTTQ